MGFFNTLNQDTYDRQYTDGYLLRRIAGYSRQRKNQKRPSERSVMARSGSLLPELSAVVSAGKLTGEEGVMRERLAGKVAAMRKLDYFEILGLPTTATREDVKRAYFALAKEYHPDKHFGSSSPRCASSRSRSTT